MVRGWSSWCGTQQAKRTTTGKLLWALSQLKYLTHCFHHIRLRPLAYPATDVVVMLCSKSSYTTLLNLKYIYNIHTTYTHIYDLRLFNFNLNFCYRYKWVGEIKNHLPRVPKILVVNKWDLDVADKSEELLTNEMISKATQDLHMDDMIKVSAKTGYNIDELIQKVGRLAKRAPRRRVTPFCRAL